MALDVELAEIRDFLGRHEPFDALPAAVLETLPPRLDVVYRRRGADLLEAGRVPEEMYVVRSGAVETHDGEGRLVERGGTGTTVGGHAVVSEEPLAGPVTALEDCLLLAVPGALVRELAARHPPVARYLAGPGTGLDQAVARRHDDADDADRAVLRTLAGDLVRRDPVSVPVTASVREAASVMADHRISSVLVTDGDRLAGILTDRDLRSRVVAAGFDPEGPVREVMTADPLTGSPDSLALEVLLDLVRRNIHHLPLLEDDRVVGMVTATDLLRLEQANPVHLVGDVAKAPDAAAVAEQAHRLDEVVASLVRQGTSAHDIGRVVTTIGDAVEQRLIGLAEEEVGAPPVPYAWLTLGSRARFEQALGPDQDHALLLHDDVRPEHEEYFATLADRVVDGLERAGYPRCQGDKMASNPRWRMPLAAWLGQVDRWVRTPVPDAVLEASVFFDLRHQHGDAALTAALARHMRVTARGSQLFQAHLAAHAVALNPPLGFFRNLVVERSGEHRDTLDLKKGGIRIVVEVARVHALAAGSPAVSTLERLEDAVADHRISATLAADLRDAWEFLSHLRLQHQAEQVRAGEQPDNRLAPAGLSAFEQRHLKAAFHVLQAATGGLAQRYPVSAMT